MNKKIYFFLMILPVVLFTGCSEEAKKQEQISFTGAFALYPLNLKWSDEYKKTHPDIRMNIQPGGAGKGLTDVLSGGTDVGMFSREITSNELEKGVWYIALAKDAVFPTISSQNPYLDILKARGLTKEEFKNIFIDGKPDTWQALLNVKDKNAVKLTAYSRSDASGAAESWAAFFDAHQDKLKGLAMMGDPGIAEAVKKDKGGIGFNNTQYIFNIINGEKTDGIEILPLDVNGNGKIDSAENFYSSLQSIESAVLDGRYPSPPVRELYFVCKQKPVNPAILSYFKWVLTEGQQYIKGAGYVPLPDSEIKEQLTKVE